MVINFSNIVPKTWPFPGLFPHMVNSEAYTYSGNKVTSIKDTCSAAYSSDFRFSNGTNTSYAFTYDASGRMTSDASKGISSITWNVLGLPQTVTFSSGAVINYSYAADGTKFREARTASSTTTTTDYTGNLVLENGTRSRLLFDGGYMSLSDNAYHYFLTDHLGSVRVVASASGTAEEYDHYYPLGGRIAKYSTATSIQPVKYQGKEWGASKGLNLYDFGARRYDPATGRWLSQDPLSEKYYAHSPYLFCGANPMRFVDPTGSIWDDPQSIQLLVFYTNMRILDLSSVKEVNQSLLESGLFSEEENASFLSSINGIEKQINFLNLSLSDINLLSEDLNNTYVLDAVLKPDHNVRLGPNNHVFIETISDAISLHEIAHVRQSLNSGGLSFNDEGKLQNSGRSINEMINNEVEAYKIQYSFDPSSFPGLLYGSSGIDGVNRMSVMGIRINGQLAYPFLNYQH